MLEAEMLELIPSPDEVQDPITWLSLSLIEDLGKKLKEPWTQRQRDYGKTFAVSYFGGTEAAKAVMRLLAKKGWKSKYEYNQRDGNFIRVWKP